MPKKFLDFNGLCRILTKLDEYPDNEILSVVINSISSELETKLDNDDLIALTANEMHQAIIDAYTSEQIYTS